LTSRFPHSDLDLDFLARKYEFKVYKHCKTVHCAYTYYYILLEEVNKSSLFSPSSILVVKSFSVERTEDGFSLPLLTACSLFRLQLPFKCFDFFKKECQRLLSGFSFGFKASLVLFLLFKFGDCSTISRIVFVLVTKVIPVDVDSNASCFTCFSSGSSSPEVAAFCPTLPLVYFIDRA
jgi:hypothetical protein